jgi:hypothetical protein
MASFIKLTLGMDDSAASAKPYARVMALCKENEIAAANLLTVNQVVGSTGCSLTTI